MNNPQSSRRYVLVTLQFFKARRNWRPVILAWIFSVVLEIATWDLKITGDANLPMAVINGSLIWLSLSLLFWLSEPVSYYLFYRWLKVGFSASLVASMALDILIVILSGVVMVNVLHLTGTATPASWLWYVGLGLLHSVRAGQFRKKKFIYKKI